VLRLAGRWLFRAAVFLAAGVLVTYLGDWIAFKLEGSPQSTVTVNRTLVVPLKNNQQEYDYLGTFDQPCSVSLFPQSGLTPCWQLRRNTNQNVKL
jgi:hypothetical protein